MLKRPNNRVWSDHDTERLRVLTASGGSVSRASVMFRRSAQAVRTKASQHGWKFPTIKQLRSRAAGLDPPTAMPPDTSLAPR
jgi:hypothetical protein